MHLTLRQLEIFIAVADCGSTSAAATHIALSQSAISGALNEFESLLGIRLFDRAGKRLVINETGRALLPQARVTLESARQIERQFGVGLPVSAQLQAPVSIRLGASTTIGNYLVPGMVAAYLRAAPLARVEVEIGNTRDVASAVARMEVDLGLIEGPCHEPDLHVEHWMDDEMVIVAAPDYAWPEGRTDEKHAGERDEHVGAAFLHEDEVRLQSGRPVALVALRQACWLLREQGSGTRETVEQALLPHLDHFESAMYLGSSEAIKQAAAAGLGVTCLSRAAVQDFVAAGRLVILNTALPRIERRFYLIRHRARILSPALSQFIGMRNPGVENGDGQPPLAAQQSAL